MEDEKIFAENIVKLRKLRNVSQKNLAIKAGTTPSYLCDIEKKFKAPNVFLANRIAKALKVKLDKLLKPI